MFTVTNNLGTFTVLANCTNFCDRCGCNSIQSFRCSTASVSRCSFRPNSLLTLSSTSSLAGSITCSDVYNEVTTVRSIQYVVIYWTACRTGLCDIIRSGYFQGQVI